jgi:molybdopterin molybdotransferase
MSEVLSCFDPSANPEAMLPVSESIERILSQIKSVKDPEYIPLYDATSRVLAEELISLINVPQQTNSAMDGYAVATESLQTGSPIKVIGQVFAGQKFPERVRPGEAVEIMTGAPVPEGTDTILIKEICTVDQGELSFIGPVKKGQHVRQAGEDIQRGQVALSPGHFIRPQEQGFIASLGLDKVKVYRKIKVAIFSTGDEVVEQGNALPENSIYDTNRFSLHGMLSRLGCEVIDFGIINDTQEAMSACLLDASAKADMVISSGGVSMGKADYIKNSLEEVGNIDFWKIAMRPGRPLAFGKVQGTPFFGLPGNPVAVMVTFSQFVQPALRKLMGQKQWAPVRMVAIAGERLKSRLHRTDYTRGVYEISEQGQLIVRSTGSQGSGILSSMVQANCFIEIEDQYDQIAEGQKVIIQPFSDLI